MADQAIRVEKLTPLIGAEVHGVDLSRPLDEATFKDVHGALIENQVIFFRDQHLTVDQHKAFGRLFGELVVHPAAPRPVEGHPEILVIHADENSKRVAGEELALRRLLRSDAAARQHPLHARAAARGRRHAVREHVRRLRGAVGCR